MRVALVMGAADHVPGGHRTQHRQTLIALRGLGVDVEDPAETSLHPGEWDLVHGFGLSMDTVRMCRSSGVPTVLSPIYWSYRHTHALDGSMSRGSDVARRMRVVASFGRSAMQDYVGAAKSALRDLWKAALLFEAVDLLLPNAEGEAQAISSELEVSTPSVIVPNGVDPNAFPFVDNPAREGVLYVGRLEPHKNQIGLLDAMADTDLAVTIVGWPHPDHPDYVDACRQRASPRVRVLLGVSDAQLRAEYAAARVHALPSWYETTGLSSLEAAASGCRIVTTDRGHAREYFGKDALYCDPAQPTSVREAVLQAYRANSLGPELSRSVTEKYSWTEVGRHTVRAYKQLLDGMQARRR